MPKKKAPEDALREGMAAGDVADVSTRSIHALQERMPFLWMSLIRLEYEVSDAKQALFARLRALLPAGIAAVWRAYEQQAIGKKPRATVAFDEGAYLAMLPCFVSCGNDAQLTAYALLSCRCSEKTARTVREALYDGARWMALAVFLGDEMKAHHANTKEDASFWTMLAVAMYGIDDMNMARICFDDAVACGGETAEIASYRAWIAAREGRA